MNISNLNDNQEINNYFHYLSYEILFSFIYVISLGILGSYINLKLKNLKYNKNKSYE